MQEQGPGREASGLNFCGGFGGRGWPLPPRFAAAAWLPTCGTRGMAALALANGSVRGWRLGWPVSATGHPRHLVERVERIQDIRTSSEMQRADGSTTLKVGVVTEQPFVHDLGHANQQPANDHVVEIDERTRWAGVGTSVPARQLDTGGPVTPSHSATGTTRCRFNTIVGGSHWRIRQAMTQARTHRDALTSALGQPVLDQYGIEPAAGHPTVTSSRKTGRALSWPPNPKPRNSGSHLAVSSPWP